MLTSQSVYTTIAGEFRQIYRALHRKPELKARTPICLCEGDSWFSTPLVMNLLDWLVFATPEDEERGVPVFGAGGLFFRAEHSGDTAIEKSRQTRKSMFTPSNAKKLLGWYKKVDFDIFLLSAGGNDFVSDYLETLFAEDKGVLTPERAFKRVVDSRKFTDVRDAYIQFVAQFVAVRPRTPILTHTYDYPRLLGVGANLTLANIGAAAMFAKGPGPWVEPKIKVVLPMEADQRTFASMLIDGFVERVLIPVQKARTSRNLFDFVDFRSTLKSDSQWGDEMHPTSEGFRILAGKLRAEIIAKLPPGKVMVGSQSDG